MKKGILRKIIGCTLALSMSMATLSACAGKKDKNAQKPTTNTQQPNNGGSVTPNPNPNPNPNPTTDKYKITVACQTEMGEEEVLQVLAAHYEEQNPDMDVEIKTFSGAGFEQYMLGIAAKPENSPNIIWTTSTNHHWDEYFTDLRPYYEATEGADYSLYYETMLDAASPNGYFKPTKNYKGEFRKDDLDVNSDGFEGYKNHSEYGLYYAPRDHNKPAILCNTYLIKELDESYEKLYKEVNSVTEMPYDYLSATARLQQIQNGEGWDSLDDLSAFARMLGERIFYIAENSTSREDRSWGDKAVLDLFLEWEPVYTTILNELNVDLIGEDGKLTLENYESTFEALHEKMFPIDNEDLNIYETEDGEFLRGNLMMTVGSRPVVLGYTYTLEQMYGEKSVAAIPFPVANIAASGSGYAISNIWDGQGMTVNGVYRSYTGLSWEFIKFMISEEGQEIAGSTGLNVPVLKQLCSAETNGGKEPAWRTVDRLGNINHDAWVAGGELRQDTFNVFIASRRNHFRFRVREFFMGFQQSDYAEGSLQALIDTTVQQYNLHKPESYLR